MTRQVRSRGSNRLAAAIVGLTVLAVPVTACNKMGSVTSSVSPCFRVLPQAHAALSGQGTFVDVARVSRSGLPRLGRLPLRRPSRPTTVPGSTSIPVQREVCLVAYRGTFDASRITGLVGTLRTGRYAIVIVGIRTQQVRLVVLADTLPKPLHAH